MTIRIRDVPEPLSRAALLALTQQEQIDDDHLIYARSGAFDILRKQILRYVDDELRGTSVLISGHRGAGKTTLVTSAVLSASCALARRPGNSLEHSGDGKTDQVKAGATESGDAMPPDAKPSDAKPGDAKPGKGRAREGEKQKQLLLVEFHAPALVKGGDGAPPAESHGLPASSPSSSSTSSSGGAKGSSSSGSTVPAASSAAESPAQVPSPRPIIDDVTDEERLLTYLMMGLHLALLREVTVGYGETVRQSAPESPALHELAVEFTRELDDFPSPARLRTYWNRINAMEKGVLFWRERDRKDKRKPRKNQGLSELLLVASSVEYYRRISGTFSHEQKEKEGADLKQDAKADSEFDLKKLILPLVGLISGSLVGGGAVLALDSHGLPASLLGLVTGTLTAASLKLGSSRSYDHTLTRSTSFERDLTVKTLRRELPRLLDRFIDAGIYPIFLIDEVDKVEKAEQFYRVLKHLKVLFSERGFFCFAADRQYYHELLGETSHGRHRKSATLYRQRLYVVQLPEDLHDYLDQVLVAIRT